MCHYKDKKRYALRRIKLEEKIYKDLENIYKGDKETPIDDDLLKQFINLHSKYNKLIMV